MPPLQLRRASSRGMVNRLKRAASVKHFQVVSFFTAREASREINLLTLKLNLLMVTPEVLCHSQTIAVILYANMQF